MDGTTAIKIDYYEELKAKADKWDEKEKPHLANKIKFNEMYDYFEGICKCGEQVWQTSEYCQECGQKLDWVAL